MSETRRGRLQRWWWRQQFEPGVAGLVLAPFYHARRGLLKELTPLLAELKGDVLDVGCGRKPYRERVPASRYVGLDIDSPESRRLGVADAFYDGRRFPFADASFDGVLCSQVLEHVFTPEAFLAEIARVLRPGGRLVLAVPFAWDEHEQPVDYARYSSFGLRALLERAGFELVEQRKSAADFRALVQLTSGWVFKKTRTRWRAMNLLVQIGLIAPVNVLGGLLAAILPGNPDFYLDNVVLARKAEGGRA